MYRTIILISFLLCSIIVFAGHNPVSDTTKTSTDTVQGKDEKPALPYQACAPRQWDIKNTRIALSFNMMEKTANVKEWIKLHPYFYATDSLTLDAKSMKIDSVQLVAKGGNTSLKYTYENDILRIRFDKQYRATDSIQLYFKYTAMPYAAPTGGNGAITDDRGLYFINTDNMTPHKHSQIWTQGETESNSHWMITIDKPNTRFTTQVELTVPDSFVTLSNGAMIKTIKGPKGMHTDIWKMDLPIQAYAVMFAAGNFSIIKDHWRKKEVNYYVEPEYAPYAKLMFSHTPEMIEYFSQRTGVPYPWNKYSEIVVRDYVSGAMENTSATLFGEFMNQNAREYADRNQEDVVSHELFHQWFGDYATCESWSNITVNESFANYGEQLWRAHYYGKNEGDELAWNDLQAYIQSTQLNDPQLVRYNYNSREDVFDAISYNKGGAILRYLNNLLGDEGFDKAMNIYLTKNALHATEALNWRLAVEEASGQDWNWFFNQWYYHGGHPVLKIVNIYNDTLKQLAVTVNQTQSDSTFLFTMPLKTAVIYGNEKKMTDWNITKKKDTFTYAYRNGVKPVIIPDYDHVLPGEIKETKKPAQWLEIYKMCDDHINKRLALNAANKQMSDDNSQTIIDLALGDTITGIRNRALTLLKTAQSEKYHRKWTPKIMTMAETDKDKQVRASAIDVLSAWKTDEAKSLFAKHVFDSSYMIAGSALEGLNVLDKDTAYLIAKKLVEMDPRSGLSYQVWSIIGKKANDEDIILYEKYAPYKLGSTKFSITGSLSSYMKNVKSDASFKRALNVFTTMVLSENMKTYRSMVAGSIFQLGVTEKGNTTSDNKDEAEAAKKRLDLIKGDLQKIIDAEKEKTTKEDFQKTMKEDFSD